MGEGVKEKICFDMWRSCESWGVCVRACVRACKVIVSFLSLFITVTVVSLFLLYPSFLLVFWLCLRKINTQKKIPLNILSRQTATKVTQYLCSRYAQRLPSATQSPWLQESLVQQRRHFSAIWLGWQSQPPAQNTTVGGIHPRLANTPFWDVSISTFFQRGKSEKSRQVSKPLMWQWTLWSASVDAHLPAFSIWSLAEKLLGKLTQRRLCACRTERQLPCTYQPRAVTCSSKKQFRSSRHQSANSLSKPPTPSLTVPRLGGRHSFRACADRSKLCWKYRTE